MYLYRRRDQSRHEQRPTINGMDWQGGMEIVIEYKMDG